MRSTLIAITLEPGKSGAYPEEGLRCRTAEFMALYKNPPHRFKYSEMRAAF